MNYNFEEDFEFYDFIDYHDSSHLSNVNEAKKLLELIKNKQKFQKSDWVALIKDNIPYLKRIVIEEALSIKFLRLDLTKYK